MVYIDGQSSLGSKSPKNVRPSLSVEATLGPYIDSVINKVSEVLYIRFQNTSQSELETLWKQCRDGAEIVLLRFYILA